MNNFFKKKTTPLDTSKTQVQDYYSIKEKLELPLKIKLFLQMLENNTEQKTEKKKIPKQITDIYKSFCKCFCKLSYEDKSYFLLAMVKIVQLILHEKDVKQGNSYCDYECKIDKIQTTCQVRQFFMGVSHWEERIFKFFNVQKLVKICSHNNAKKQIAIQLNQYHIRTSTKQKNTLVLECIFDSWKLPEKYHSFYIYLKDKPLFLQIYKNLRNAIIMTWKLRLIGMLNEIEKNTGIENLGMGETSGSAGVRMLTSKTISDYFKTKQVLTKMMQKNIKWKQFSQIRKVKILRSSKYQNLYKTQNILDHSYDDVLKNIELVSRVPTKKLLHYEKMETFSNTISAVYYKYMVKGCTHEMLCIVEELNKENEFKISYKAIDNFVMEKNVEFVEIKVQRIGAGKTKVSAFGFINFDQNKKLNPVSVVDFFLSIVEYQQNDEATVIRSTAKNESTFQVESTKIHEQCPQQPDNEDEFHTVVGDNFDSEEQRQLQICNTFESPKKQDQDMQDLDQVETQHERNVINEFRYEKTEENYRKSSRQIMQETNKTKCMPENQYLKHKHIPEPLPPTKQKQLMKQHYFIGEWGHYEKGGVYSLNTKAIDKQKQIYRSMLTRLGNAIMKKKWSNLSIPVIGLKEESMLESIARDMSYAPLILEGLQNKDSLERMKSAVVFMVSVGAIGLSYSKPFNPLLGQTFQASIDNCPVYMQQTSHHPPISTLFFKGRGYDVHGSVYPAISLRINSVKGFSQTPFKIQFSNGDIIQFHQQKMLIGGLLVGDRTFDFCDTCYMFDEKHRIIAEITFGPKKKFGKQMKGDKTDFLWGYIFQVSQTFMNKFLKQGKNLSPMNDKGSKIMAQVYGCWYEKIYIDENLVFDFQTQLPCKMITDKYCLRSDSRLRNDIKFLLQEKYPEAQDEKDRIEELQREDAKLRKNYHK